MKAKHSPGPWSLHGSKAHPWLVEAPSNVPGMPAPICVIGYKPNAQLIAAAPELLAALASLLARCGELDQSATHDGLQNCQALAQARAAIAKATGE